MGANEAAPLAVHLGRHWPRGRCRGIRSYWFQPWKLVTDRAVDDALPIVASIARAPTPAGSSTAAPAGDRILAAGDFVTHEHETTGRVEVVRRADGRLLLVLRDLDTSNGPDLRVWLTDQSVISGRAGWNVFDDGNGLK
jgi:hypothetical protein